MTPTALQVPTLSYSAFSVRDVANLALQRTGALTDFPRVGKYSYLSWRKGNDLPLLAESALRRRAITRYCTELVANDYAQLADSLPTDGVECVTDIGSGYGLIDLFLFRRYGCHVQLVDIESSPERDHNFAARGAGYTSLDVARNFLRANGVPDDRIVTRNPNHQPLPERRSDLIVSLLSLAFHYPFDTYSGYIGANLKPGGTLVIDVRRKAKQDTSLLARFAERTVVKETAKYDRMVLTGFGA